ncbi:MAG: hypothetical protein ACYC8T_30535 [Myxococcaceae bacterium]
MTTEPAAARPKPVSRPLWQPVLEAAALSAVMVALNVLFFRDNPGLVRWSPHPILAVTLLILARYGFLAGVFAALLSVLSYAGLLIGLAKPATPFDLLAAPYSTPVAVLVPVTVLLGMLVQRHLDRLRAVEQQRERLAGENAALKGEQAKLRDVNVELAGKVVGAGATLQTLYRYAKDLNVNDVGLIYSGVARMLEDVVKAEVTSVWVPNVAGQLKLAARQGSGDTSATFALTKQLRARLDKGVIALHDLPDEERAAGLPYLLGRVTAGKGGEVAAYLAIEKLPFARYNAETIRLFTMVVEWASESVGNALALQKLSPAEREERLKKQRALEQKAVPKAAAPAARVRPPGAAGPGRSETGLSRLLQQASQALDTGGQESRIEPLPPALAGRAPPVGEGREATGTGLRGLLADADNMLTRRRANPLAPEKAAVQTAQPAAGDPVADAEVVKVIERTVMFNQNLGLLLNEIGSYLSEGKDK